MHRFILAFCLLASPCLAQVDANDPTLLPDETIAAEATDAATGDAAAKAVAQVLATPAAQKTAIDLAMTRLKVPEALRAVMAEHLAAMLAEPTMAAEFTQAMAETFTRMGITPSNPDVIARMAGEQLAGWGDDLASLGMQRLSADEKRRVLALRLQIVANSSADDCAGFLTGTRSAGQNRAMFIATMASWPADQARAAFALSRRAILAELRGRPVQVPLTEDEYAHVTDVAGTAIAGAFTDNPRADVLLAAFGYPEQAEAADICAAHRTMLQALQNVTGRDGVLIARYLIENGLNG